MNYYYDFLSKNKYRLGFLAIIFSAALITSNFLGPQAVKSCIWLTSIILTAGFCSVAPVIYRASKSAAVSISLAMLASIIRSLIILAGTITVLIFTQINVLWFVLWLAVLYPPMLIIDVLMIMPDKGR